MAPMLSAGRVVVPRSAVRVAAARGDGAVAPPVRALGAAKAGTLGGHRWTRTATRPGARPPVRSRQRLQVTSTLPVWINPEAPEPFTFFNTVVLIPWTMMIVAPRWEGTRKLMEPDWIMIPYCLIDLVYFVMTAVLDSQAGEDVNAKLVFLFTEAIADPQKMLSLFDNPAYAAQDWVHLCTWDLLAGRWLWKDGLSTGVPVRFALFTAFNSGPPGLLVYLLTKAIWPPSTPEGKAVSSATE